MASDEQTRPEEEGGVSEDLPAISDRPNLYGTITSTGINYDFVDHDDYDYQLWEQDLKVIWFLYQWSPWALGDCLAYGADHFPDRYEQAVETTGKALQTLYNKTLLSRQFPNRNGLRSEKLSPGHHAVLLGMSEEDKRHYLREGEKKYAETNGHFGWRDFKAYVEQEEKERSGAKTQKTKPPPKCGECFGSGKCPRCHGSGEEHVS